MRSGTTAVVALIRGNKLYSAWLGDSQSVLVRHGKPVKIVEPHKPDRAVSFLKQQFVDLIIEKALAWFPKRNFLFESKAEPSLYKNFI